MLAWLTSQAFHAFGAPTTRAELLGFATGLLLMVAFWHVGLFGGAGLQIVYVVLGGYGWWRWSTGTVRPRVRLTTYLLTSHEGVPFTDDGMRDGEHLRARMTELAAGVPWIELDGSYRARLTRAVRACDELLARGWSLASPLLPADASRIVGGSC